MRNVDPDSAENLRQSREDEREAFALRKQALCCPKCGGVDWYQFGNLRCCFPCAEGFIVAPDKLQNTTI